jgi:formylglycine-generating enzyme required for sulfatase activity
MIYIPAGEFAYGEKATTKRKSKEEIGAFCIDVHEFPNTPGVRPLTGVTWMEAASKCEQVGKRLCTEYEWEKACRGRGGRRYPWGGKFLAANCPGATGDAGGYASGANEMCSSPYGVRDMSGSVWEWTSNAYDGDPLRRVVRGGYDADVGYLSARCSYRRGVEASQSSPNMGFRCCTKPTVVPLGGVGYGP